MRRFDLPMCPRLAWALTGNLCRSELAREKPEDAAGKQVYRVIVDVLREQARSYRGTWAAARFPQGHAFQKGNWLACDAVGAGNRNLGP